MDIWSNTALIWFLVGLVMFLLEGMMPGLVIFFFGLGAWIVAVLALFLDISLNMQLGIFILASAFSLIFLRRLLKKVFFGHKSNEQNLAREMNEFIGGKAVVKEKIGVQFGGKVEMNGTLWDAEADEEIGEGEVVKIIKQNNLTFRVKKFN